MKEITLVPKDKCPFDFIEEIVKQKKDSWIFIHNNVLEKLISSADRHKKDSISYEETVNWLLWEKDSSKELITGIGPIWFRVKLILDNRTGFVSSNPNDPNEILFLKMGE